MTTGHSIASSEGTGSAPFDVDVFDRHVNRLAELSDRPKVAWRDQIANRPWDLAGIGTDPLAAWDPLRQVPAYQQFAADPALELPLRRILAFYAVGEDLELILRRGLARIASGLRDDDPAVRYIAHEIIEEAEHTAMFEWFTALAGAHLPRHTSISDVEIRRVSALAGTNPAAFLLYVVCGELMFDRVQKAAISSGDAHPLIERIDRIHRAEEARHLSFGRMMLGRMLTAADVKLVRRLTYEAPTIARWTAVRVIDMPDSLHTDIGATARDRAQARSEVLASDLCRDAINDLREFCAEVGLEDGRLDGAWNFTGSKGTEAR